MESQKTRKDKERNAKHEVVAVFITAAILIGVYFLMQQWPVRDFFGGLGYQPTDKTQEIHEALELTPAGDRILAATKPIVEASTEFNEHCDSHKTEVSLLGCYTDGKIYVYEITTPELVDSNKVTMAHELLHAVWERMSEGERRDVEKLLEQVRKENAEWFQNELASYPEEEKLEEVYTRAGTKLKNLPEELEKHYAKYFKNRQKIVEYYEKYQEPFRKLQEKNAELEAVIIAVKAEITVERAEYLDRARELDKWIEEFNECANRAGCFSSNTAFMEEREKLLQTQAELTAMRERLNAKIDENNARVEEFQKNQIALGELNDAMNSNAEERQE